MERDRARKDGVSCDDNLPFLLGPEDAETAVLLVHGFTATPWEMRLIGEFLAREGICTMAVRLSGHGTTPEDLAHRTWQEWLAAVRHGHALLAKSHPQVFGLGMSTGCLLLLAQALEQTFRGLVLCSPYLRIQHRLAAHAGWLHWLRPYHGKRAGAASLHYYDRRPVAGVHQISRLIKHLRPQLGDCKAPVLAFNGEGDQTIVVDSGRDLIRQLGSSIKIYHCYGKDVPHILTREESPVYLGMFEMIRVFVRELVDPGEFRRPNDGTER